MCGEGFFDGLGPPAGRVAQHEVTVDVVGRDGHDLVVPGDPVDVGLHDDDVRGCGRPVGVHHRGEVPVEVVRSDAVAHAVGHRGHLGRLPEAVPDAVDDRYVERPGNQIRVQLADAEQRFRTADRAARLRADVRHSVGMVGVDLDPEESEVGKLCHDAGVALGAGVEVQVQQQVHAVARTVTKRLQRRPYLVDELARDVQLGRERRAEAGKPATQPVVRLAEDVGLEGCESLLGYLCAERPDAVEVGDAVAVDVTEVDAPGPAVRPVHADAVAHLATQQVVAGHPQRAGLGVEQRVLDRAECFADDAAGGLAGAGEQVLVDGFMVEHGAADDQRCQRLDGRGEAGRGKPLVVLRPADDAIGRGDLQEVVVPPRCVARQRLDALDQRSGIGRTAGGCDIDHCSAPCRAAGALDPG